MRMLKLSVALMLALGMTACKQTQTKQSADTATASQSVAAQPQPPDLRTPEQKEAEARLKASKQLMINQLNAVLVDLDKQGIKVKKTPQKKPWRLIVPALQKVSDPGARKEQALAIAQSFRAQVEPLMGKPIDVAIYADDHETQQLN